MKKPGFDWPTCPQANSSAARYEQYDECSAGFIATGGDGRFGRRDDNTPALCQRTVRTGPTIGIPSKFPSHSNINHADESINIVGDVLRLDDGTEIQLNVSRGTRDGRNGYWNQATTYTYRRPVREEPWYIEYDDANGVRQRTWFNLDL